MDSADGGRRGYGPRLDRAYYVRYEPLRAGRVRRDGRPGRVVQVNLLGGDTDRRYVVRVHRPHVTSERR